VVGCVSRTNYSDSPIIAAMVNSFARLRSMYGMISPTSWRRLWWRALMACLCAPAALKAQRTVTDCDVRQFRYNNSATVSCTSSTIQDPWATFTKSFREAYEREERAANQRRQLQLLEQQNRMVEASLSASEARIASEREELRREARAKNEAAARLFWRRAGSILQSVGDSLSLGDAGYRRLVSEAYPILQDIFTASPSASNAEITDNLLPVVLPYRRRSSEFDSAVNAWIAENRIALQGVGSKGVGVVATTIAAQRQDFMGSKTTSSLTVRAALQRSVDLLALNRSDCSRAIAQLERWIAGPSSGAASKPAVPSCLTDIAPDDLARRWNRTYARADSVEAVRLRRSIEANAPRRNQELDEVAAKAGAFTDLKGWGKDLAYLFRLRVEMAVKDAPSSAPVNVDRVVADEGGKLSAIVEGCLKGIKCDRWAVDTATYRKFREANRSNPPR